MKKSNKIIIITTIIIILVAIVGILAFALNSKKTTDLSSLNFDMSKWNYDTDNNVYYQIGVQYCANPETTEYETLGIYIPGEYLNGTQNSDGTYTCTINEDGKKNEYTSNTAPIILPVDTPGYSAQKAPTSYNYNSIKDYIDAGYVYVLAGMRGRGSMQGTTESLGFSGGVPYGITDLKATVRFYRYNKEALPGNTDSIFSYGMSGGGAQSALIGATGDSELYYPYLESIGAAMTDSNGNKISDAIAGSMCWCPITNLDIADEAYEWNMGQYFSTNTRAEGTFTAEFSDDLSEAFATYINALGLKSEDGTVLKLEQSENGIYASGSYYDYILSEIETSLNNFLEDTTFPYTYTATKTQVGNTAESGESLGGNMNFGGKDKANNKSGDNDRPMKDMNGGTMDGNFTPDFENGQDGEKEFKQGNFGGNMQGGFGQNSSSSSNEGTVYETAQDYINFLNSDVEWVKYDSSTNKVKITSIEAFVTHCKNAQKTVGAFDSLDRSQGENNVFGNGQDESKHFDSIEYDLLKENEEKYSKYSDWNSSYITDYKNDLISKDALGIDMQTRVNMYNPMYYLSNYYDGNGTSTVAKYWRIRTGINQTDTALTTEENLKLALQNNSNVESVDFATVWGQPHTTAERTGSSTTNFINWVNECLK